MKVLKTIRKIIGKPGEILIFSLIIGLINIYFHNDPGFFNAVVNPYLIITLIISSFYGKYYGYLSLAFSAFIIALLFPIIIEFFFYPGTWKPEYWLKLRDTGILPFSFTIAGIYIFGIIRDSIESNLKKEYDRTAGLSKQKSALIKGLETVNRELETRVTRQEDSVSSLYTWIQRLYTLNLQIAIETILEIAQKFSAATKASIWEYHSETKELKIIQTLGWVDEKINTIIPVENTIEGWVVRNNMIFSIRMLLQYENLKKMDTGRNIFTLPILAGRKMWGILNIEEMPFSKYNLYTERLLAVILSLASPSLEKAIEFDSVIRQSEINAYTGLPSFSIFFSLLEKEIKRMSIQKGTLSIVIIEILNFDSISTHFGEHKVFSIFNKIIEEAKKLSAHIAGSFHYKHDNQIVLLFPNLDFDGTSSFCLELLEAINNKHWEINEEEISLETIIGYSSLGEKNIRANEMLKIAENLLEMQKI